jgi:hypothetical protein
MTTTLCPAKNRRATKAAPHEWGFKKAQLEAGLPGAALVARAFMSGRWGESEA